MKKILRFRSGVSLIELLVVIGVISVLVALLLPAVQLAREAARRAQCRNNLKQIGVALHGYHSAHKLFPPGYICQQDFLGSSQRNQWGWSALLLPYLNQAALYETADFSAFVRDDAGDVSPAVESNQDIAELPLPMFRCPSDVAPEQIDRSCPFNPSVKFGVSNYSASSGITLMGLPCWGLPTVAAPVSAGSATAYFHPLPVPCEYPEGIFYINSSHSISHVSDGTSNTFAIGETSWKWHYQTCRSATIPEPFGGTTWAGVAHCANQEHVTSVTSLPFDNEFDEVFSFGFSSPHVGGVFFLMADGAVRFVGDSINNVKSPPYGVLQWLSSRNGQETTDGF